MKDKKIAAMAIAVIAEETGEKFNHLRIVSFRKIEKSSLYKYIENKNIKYKKYELGD